MYGYRIIGIGEMLLIIKNKLKQSGYVLRLEGVYAQKSNGFGVRGLIEQLQRFFQAVFLCLKIFSKRLNHS